MMFARRKRISPSSPLSWFDSAPARARAHDTAKLPPYCRVYLLRALAHMLRHANEQHSTQHEPRCALAMAQALRQVAFVLQAESELLQSEALHAMASSTAQLVQALDDTNMQLVSPARWSLSLCTSASRSFKRALMRRRSPH